MKRFTILISFCLALVSCETESEEFEPFTKDISQWLITPSVSTDYYEIKIGPNANSVFYSKNEGRLDSVRLKCIRHKFDSVQVDSGFSYFPHIHGYHYVLSWNDDKIELWNSIEELREFFGDIDTRTEAQIYAMAHGFPPVISDTVQTGVIQTDSGYIVRVTRTDALCSPVVANRYKLFVRPQGKLDTLKVEELWRSQGCI